jgi:dienelactone hydrolase
MLLRAVVILLATLGSACVSNGVRFPNATPGAPRAIVAEELKPKGAGPFPAVVLLHGCHGVSRSTRDWARWFAARGFVSLVVDSWASRGMKEGCSPTSSDIPNTERFDDGVGALRYFHGRPYVDRDRIGVIGWSNGGVFSIALVNGPSHERARRRGVTLPEPGYRAAVAVYPGGCYSLVNELVVRPLLVLIGGSDDWTLPEFCADMVHAMRAKGADASIVIYPGAVHYFDVVGQPRVFLTDVENRNLPGQCCGATVGYEPTADADAHQRIAEFFDRQLGVKR